jgi:multiple sugar transport system ATP-binding protein
MGREGMNEDYIKLININKKFGKTIALRDVNLSIKKGEFFALLGPSGCGKTTTLRIIAGLEYPDSGKVFIDGIDVTYKEPRERDVAMVFQDYALYPHMTVFDNIAFPLTIRKSGLTKSEINEKVHSVAKLLGIEELLELKPRQLSGGQQQRVALARALVRNPKVWLMDEPLSNLDALLRVQMRAELKKLQKDLKITTVYVTHDQIEALTMADRIAVMDKGTIIQVGTPSEIYNNPNNVFVATFIGSPPMNILECNMEDDIIKYARFQIKKVMGITTNEFYLGIRPEHLKIVNNINEVAKNEMVIKGKIYVIEPLGSEFIVNLKINDHIIKVKTLQSPQLLSGEEVYLSFNVNNAYIFDRNSGKYLMKLIDIYQDKN